MKGSRSWTACEPPGSGEPCGLPVPAERVPMCSSHHESPDALQDCEQLRHELTSSGLQVLDSL